MRISDEARMVKLGQGVMETYLKVLRDNPTLATYSQELLMKLYMAGVLAGFEAARDVVKS